MGRHTKATGSASGVRPGRVSLSDRCSRLVRRIPLLPAVAGACAVTVVVTAIGSSQVSLTFTDNPPRSQARCTGASCPATHTATPDADVPETRPSGRAPGTRVPSVRPAMPAASPAKPRRTHRVGATARRGGSASPRPSPRPKPVTVAFQRIEQWPGGYVSTATITNRGRRPVDTWTLAFRVEDASVTHAWDVDVVRTGRHVVVRNWPDEPPIAPGQSVEIGFAADGTYHPPRDCEVNDAAC